MCTVHVDQLVKYSIVKETTIRLAKTTIHFITSKKYRNKAGMKTQEDYPTTENLW